MWNKRRQIPLNKRARQILLDLGEELFKGLKKESVTHKFGDILRRVGLSQFKLHSLRHSFATRLVSAGVDIVTVKELLGHQDIRTSTIYSKANAGALRQALERLEN